MMVMKANAASAASDRARLLGRRVRERREAAGLTAGQLATYATDVAADGVKITKSWLSRLERGQIEGPSTQRMGRVARALGCDIDDLMGVPSRLPRVDDPELELLFNQLRTADLSPTDLQYVKEAIRAAMKIRRDRSEGGTIP